MIQRVHWFFVIAPVTVLGFLLLRSVTHRRPYSLLNNIARLLNMNATQQNDGSGDTGSSDAGLPIAFGIGELQGRRPYMEDRNSVVFGFGNSDDENTSTRCFFGVFDGHGGEAASTWCKKKIHHNLVQQTDFPKDMRSAMRNALLETDEEFLRTYPKSSMDDGSTVIFCVLELHTSTLYVANAGDSRGIICRKGVSVALSEDHKPDREDEKARIQAAGGMVQQASLFGKYMGPYRVYTGRRTGGLAVSRGLGDGHLKHDSLVIAEPDIRTFHLTKTDEFMLLATDGLWDVFSNQDACDFVRKYFSAPAEERLDPSEVADLLVHEAIKQGSLDNVTVMLVYFTDTSNFTGPQTNESVSDVDTTATAETKVSPYSV